jgi:hypothetical protein
MEDWSIGVLGDVDWGVGAVSYSVTPELGQLLTPDTRLQGRTTRIGESIAQRSRRPQGEDFWLSGANVHIGQSGFKCEK